MLPLTAAVIRDLRRDTGAPMMECKRALEEAEGDYEAAKAALLGPRNDPEEPMPVE